MLVRVIVPHSCYVKWTGNNSGKHLTYNARSIKCNFDKLKDSSSGVHNWGIDSDVDM
jgi:hypothetical protein